MTRSVVTHRIQQLEHFINAPLFHRSTRHVRLSEVGETYYKECADMVAGFNSLTEQMRNLRAKPTGKLRVQMLPGFAIDHFGPLLAEFTALYPDIEVDVIVNDRLTDPIEEGFDIAFQMFPPQAETLIERKLFSVRRLFLASPEYLQRHPAPERPADLLEHRIGLYEGYPSRNRWQFQHGDETVELSLAGQVRSNSVHLLRDYALAGTALVCLPTLVAHADLESGRLLPLLIDYPLSSFNFSAVFRHPAARLEGTQPDRLPGGTDQRRALLGPAVAGKGLGALKAGTTAQFVCDSRTLLSFSHRLLRSAKAFTLSPRLQQQMGATR